MEKTEIVDVEKIVEQGKAFLKGEAIPKSTDEVKSTLETIGSEVEQVRYAEGERLSEAGQAVLKDLEEILVGGAEVTAAIPPETFLHAARAQQKAVQAGEEIGKKTSETVEKEGAEIERATMNLASLLRMLFGSAEFRDVLSDWSNWLKEALIVQIEETQKTFKEQVKLEPSSEIGQVPTEEMEMALEPRSKVPKVSDEQLDKLIGMLEWMQERDEYQTAIGYIFNQFGNISTILGIKDTESETGAETEQIPQSVDDIMEEAKRVGVDTLKALENWTHRSTDTFRSHLNSVSDHLKSDSRVRSDLQSLAHFLANCFNEPGFLNDRKWIREEARDRIDNVREAVEGEGYKNELRGIADEARGLIKSLDREPRSAQLKESLRRLLEDLFVTDPSSSLTAGFRLKTELLNDMGVIVGGLLQRAKYLRVPDIEVHDDDLDFTAHNVILDAAELVPQQFKMTVVTENFVEKAKQQQMAQEEEAVVTEADKERVFVHLEPSSSHAPTTILSESADWKTHLKFEVKGIHGHCRNIHFNVRKRTGFPQISDEGLADLRVWGPKGMVVKVVLRPEWVKEETIEREVHTKETIETTSSGKNTIKPESSTSASTSSSNTSKDVKQKFKLSIVKAHCEIDELDLDLHGTRRDWFYSVMGPLVRKRVKTALESAVEQNLLSLMD